MKNLETIDDLLPKGTSGEFVITRNMLLEMPILDHRLIENLISRRAAQFEEEITLELYENTLDQSIVIKWFPRVSPWSFNKGSFNFTFTSSNATNGTAYTW